MGSLQGDLLTGNAGVVYASAVRCAEELVQRLFSFCFMLKMWLLSQVL